MTLMEAAFVGQSMNPYVGIDSGHDGFLADGTNAWVKALSKLIESAELRKKVVNNATKYVESHFMIEKQISKWRDLVSF